MNNYVDTSVQKGFIGCFEQTSSISQLLQEARVNTSDLRIVWLDQANAYDSIPHEV